METLAGVDVLMSPTTPYPAPKHDALTARFQSADDVRERFFFRRAYTGAYSLAALPAISVPCGFTGDRLPIGLQIGGRPFDEETVLRVAHAYERGDVLEFGASASRRRRAVADDCACSPPSSPRG